MIMSSWFGIPCGLLWKKMHFSNQTMMINFIYFSIFIGISRDEGLFIFLIIFRFWLNLTFSIVNIIKKFIWINIVHFWLDTFYPYWSIKKLISCFFLHSFSNWYGRLSRIVDRSIILWTDIDTHLSANW